MNQTELIDTLEEIQDMCKNVLILYNAHAQGNQELTDLANLTGYLLWNYTKSLITLKHLLNMTLRCEQDFAIGELCVVINECTKKIIGFKTKDGKNRKESLWINKMGRYITIHPELTKEYNLLKEKWIFYADSSYTQGIIKDLRDVATHGDIKIDELIKLHNASISDIINYLDNWGKIMQPTANFVFNCFENKCKQVMNITN